MCKLIRFEDDLVLDPASLAHPLDRNSSIGGLKRGRDDIKLGHAI